MQSNKFGKIKIYGKSPFSISFDDVIKFDSVEEQESFFENSPLLTEIYSADDCSWIKKTGSIQVKGELPLFEKATYMWFENERGKRYYAFVLDTFYTNQDCTNIIFEIDAWQTFHIDLFASSFSGYVEQAHEKNYLDPEKTKRNISLIPQNIPINKRYYKNIKALELVDWIVVVLKPGAKTNGSDINVGKPGIPGTFKSFRYFVIPAIVSDGVTLPYAYGNTVVSGGDLYSVIEFYTNTFSDADTGLANNNTVNQCVNIYTSKYIGIPYEYKNGVVYINGDISGDISGFDFELDVEDDSINQGTYDGEVDYSGTLTYGGHTLSNSVIKRLILWCRVFKVLPELIITCWYNETQWGNTGVGQYNNWGGYTYPGSSNSISYPSINITVTKASNPRWMQFASVNDMIAYACYLFRPKGYDNSGNVIYAVSGKTVFSQALKGMFKIGGAKYNYSDPVQPYLDAMYNVNAGIRRNNPGQFELINSYVYR